MITQEHSRLKWSFRVLHVLLKSMKRLLSKRVERGFAYFWWWSLFFAACDYATTGSYIEPGEFGGSRSVMRLVSLGRALGMVGAARQERDLGTTLLAIYWPFHHDLVAGHGSKF